MTENGPVDLAPQRKNPWGDALNKLFSGSFCDPDEEPIDEDDHKDSNGSHGNGKPEVVGRSVFFSEEVIVSDGKNTPQARKLDEIRKARSEEAKAVNEKNQPSNVNKRSIFPKQKNSEQEDNLTSPSSQKDNKDETIIEKPVVQAAVEQEIKPRGILKQPAATKKQKRQIPPDAPRTNYGVNLFLWTVLALVLTLASLHYLGYGLDFSLENKKDGASFPFRIIKMTEQVNEQRVELVEVGDTAISEEEGEALEDSDASEAKEDETAEEGTVIKEGETAEGNIKSEDEERDDDDDNEEELDGVKEEEL